MNKELFEAVDEICREKGIPKEILLGKLEAALTTAYKKELNASENVYVVMNEEKSEIRVLSTKEVVEEVENPSTQINLEEAHRINRKLEIGDTIEIELIPKEFGRISAHAAKNVITQGIREAERGIVYQEFSSKEHEVLSGIVTRVDHGSISIEIGKTDVYLMSGEQIPGEKFQKGDRVKIYVVEVKEAPKGPLVKISRTHPGLVKRLMELEVPEIHDGVVEIKAIAREAGSRTKVAVWTKFEDIDPIGSCIGPKGSRIASIVAELKGEKIDVIRYHEDPAEFIAEALSPAQVVSVLVSQSEKSCRAIVPDGQLSLAIGKEGQNARLAAKLTGWKIDIKPESEAYKNI
ncbi:MAG: transcription termination factor NusA [Bacillota bacterium]|nr:transcription termination factor NusA [Bacillota bacterium]